MGVRRRFSIVNWGPHEDRHEGLPKAISFIQGDSLNLPKKVCWYPEKTYYKYEHPGPALAGQDQVELHHLTHLLGRQGEQTQE
jgi:hypothetical protein